MHPSPSPSPLQIKSQDLFQSWVAQLRAHRLAQHLDVPRSLLPSTTHRKVRWALGQRQVMWGFRMRLREAGTLLTLDSPHRFLVPSFRQRAVPRLCQGLDLGRRCLPG